MDEGVPYSDEGLYTNMSGLSELSSLSDESESDKDVGGDYEENEEDEEVAYQSEFEGVANRERTLGHKLPSTFSGDIGLVSPRLAVGWSNGDPRFWMYDCYLRMDHAVSIPFVFFCFQS